MPIINAIISWLMKKRVHQIELFMKYPLEVQQEWFRKLIESGRNTAIGTEYGFRDINSTGQFQQRIPIHEYESLKPYIDRLRDGEQNVLWNGEIRWYAKSSGTTGDRSKFIPVSQETLEECHFKGGKDLLSIYCNNHPETLIFHGKSIAMGGTHSMQEINNESYYTGDLSAIIIQNLPFWAELRRTPDLSIALMDEWEDKICKMAEATMVHDVTSISGVPSWTLLLLKKILEISGRKNIDEVWPNFEVFFHGGVSFRPYREQFRDLFPAGRVQFMETYNASEGFFGIQDQTDSDELLLMLDYGIFYEFIPATEAHSDQPKAYLLGEVQKGVNYAMVITTNSGLWRYMIGDTVEFTSLHPFRIRITGRTRQFINVFGEELIIDNADKAIAEACRRTHVKVNDYTAAPRFFQNEKNGAHEWIIEFHKPPDDPEVFCSILDHQLQSLNSDYEAKRYKDMILQPPIVHIVPSGTFYNWLKMKGKLGGQNKVPRLSNDRKILEEILINTENNPTH